MAAAQGQDLRNDRACSRTKCKAGAGAVYACRSQKDNQAILHVHHHWSLLRTFVLMHTRSFSRRSFWVNSFGFANIKARMIAMIGPGDLQGTVLEWKPAINRGLGEWNKEECLTLVGSMAAVQVHHLSKACACSRIRCTAGTGKDVHEGVLSRTSPPNPAVHHILRTLVLSSSTYPFVYMAIIRTSTLNERVTAPQYGLGKCEQQVLFNRGL